MTKRKRDFHLSEASDTTQEHRTKVARHHLAQEVAETCLHDPKIIFQLTRGLKPGVTKRLLGYLPEYTFEKGRSR
jgi:hypothetical protein